MVEAQPQKTAARFVFVISLTIALGLIGSAGAWAQPKSQARQLQQGQAPLSSWPIKSKRWALVIGVDRYKDKQISTLTGAANDAHLLAESLIRYAGFPSDQVILLATDQPEERQPTRINILTFMSNLSSLVPKDGLLLVSFSGHGIERSNQAYLIPSDARLSDDISLLEESAVSVARVHDRIKATGVGQVIVLLDACRNDPGGRADAPNPLTASYTRAFNFDIRNREVQAFATLYATAIGQRAYEYTEKRQGYFTWAVVEALKGGAANETGEVTLAKLIEYVQNVVPKRIGIDLGAMKQQRPFAVVEGYKADTLVIAVANPAAATMALPPGAATADSASLEMSFWESIKNSSDPADFQAYLDRFPSGTFAALARRRATRTTASSPSEPASNPLSPLAGKSVENALAQAERDYNDNDYGKVMETTTAILNSNPEQPKANLLLGLAYLKLQKFTNSANYLTKAIAAGEQVVLPINHHHYVFLVGDQLCSGNLTIGKGLFEFHSTTASGHDFSVPVSKVSEMAVEQLTGGRIRTKVFLQKGNKEEKKTYNFLSTRAFVGKKAGSSVTEIFCDDCLGELQGMATLLQQLIKASAQGQETSVTGIQPAAKASDSGATQASQPAASPDNDKLLQELLDFERRALEFITKGDRTSFGDLMVDEFTQVQDGKTYTKQQLLSRLKPAKYPLSLSYETVSASLNGEQGILSGIAVLRAQSGSTMVTVREKFTDTFVRREGRWLALKSEIATLK